MYLKKKDEIDSDDDNDGILDHLGSNRREFLKRRLADTDGDGIPNWLDLDDDNDGVLDELDDDDDNDGIADELDDDDNSPAPQGADWSSMNLDIDNDGLPDDEDDDDDNDGILDAYDRDANGNGIPDNVSD